MTPAEINRRYRERLAKTEQERLDALMQIASLTTDEVIKRIAQRAIREDMGNA